MARWHALVLRFTPRRSLCAGRKTASKLQSEGSVKRQNSGSSALPSEYANLLSEAPKKRAVQSTGKSTSASKQSVKQAAAKKASGPKLEKEAAPKTGEGNSARSTEESAAASSKKNDRESSVKSTSKNKGKASLPSEYNSLKFERVSQPTPRLPDSEMRRRRTKFAVGGRHGVMRQSLNPSGIPAALSLPYTWTAGNVTFETGRIARLSNGAVLAKSGGNTVLASFVREQSNEASPDGMLKLTLDYKEKAASRGMLPKNPMKQERQSEKETLVARLMDRSMRPVFEKGIMDNLQLSCAVLSADKRSDTDPLAINAASAAIMLSDQEWAGPVAAVRLAYADKEFIPDPTVDQLRSSTLNIVYAGTKHGMLALEAEGAEIPERIFAKAVNVAHQQILPIIKAQEDLARKLNQKSWKQKLPQNPYETLRYGKKLEKECYDSIRETFKALTFAGKRDRARFFGRLMKSCIDLLPGKGTPEERIAVNELVRKAFRDHIFETKVRLDGRKLDELRSIRAEVAVLSGDVHGSAIFERGDTQVLATTTLGLPFEAQKLDDYLAAVEKEKRFLLHYEFPAFSTGEIGSAARKNRREIGHGRLAEKSLASIVPVEKDSFDPDEIFSGALSVTKKDDGSFRHVVRVNADVLGSDGSSSMATVCAGSLALMDAGVPMKTHVAGISIGLVTSQDQKDHLLLTDILGMEDHLGDMDFKVSGTEAGITAVQMDVKLQQGLPLKLVPQILKRAKEARTQILDVMKKAVPVPNKKLAASAPAMDIIRTEPLMRPLLIKNGMEMLRRITDATSVHMKIEETGDLHLFAPSQDALATARRLVHELIGEVEVGTDLSGPVVRVLDFGVFVEVRPGRQGLLHISQIISPEQRASVNVEEDLPKIGEVLNVTVTEYDKSRGLIKLKLKR
mmetsp:Transcript_252/g.805  ORF Transcript_252/g.805 Transcript_252/m.805 type:complete len:907 (-) Transcript_252:118-2838(-)